MYIINDKKIPSEKHRILLETSRSGGRKWEEYAASVSGFVPVYNASQSTYMYVRICKNHEFSLHEDLRETRYGGRLEKRLERTMPRKHLINRVVSDLAMNNPFLRHAKRPRCNLSLYISHPIIRISVSEIIIGM